MKIVETLENCVPDRWMEVHQFSVYTFSISIYQYLSIISAISIEHQRYHIIKVYQLLATQMDTLRELAVSVYAAVSFL